MQETNTPQTPKGRILAIDTGPAATKVGFFVDGTAVREETLPFPPEKAAGLGGVMDQEPLRKQDVTDFLARAGFGLGDIDVVMARGGLFAPVVTGVYRVGRDMRDVLMTCRDGTHACNLSAVIADDIADSVNEYRQEKGIPAPFGPCQAYIADPPMADEMLPECHLTGIPELPRRAFFHALNSRATVKQYLRDKGRSGADVTAIVAHLGRGITVTLHHGGKVIDTNNGLGGDGPFTADRAGSIPALDLVSLCYSGQFTEAQMRRKILGGGGAMGWFGTADLDALSRRAREGDPECSLFMKAFCLNIAKQIAATAATVEGKVDVILLTGDTASLASVCEAIARRVRFIAPVETYPGEHALQSLAENGYAVLEGTVRVHRYDKNAIVPD